jgi:hypothetical protein
VGDWDVLWFAVSEEVATSIMRFPLLKVSNTYISERLYRYSPEGS